MGKRSSSAVRKEGQGLLQLPELGQPWKKPRLEKEKDVKVMK